MTTSTRKSPPPWTLAGFNLGMRLALPVLPGMMAFGLAVGATAARKGFTFVDNLLMNAFVYAGMSQLVAMEAWPERDHARRARRARGADGHDQRAHAADERGALSMARRIAGLAHLSDAARADRSVVADRHALSRQRRHRTPACSSDRACCLAIAWVAATCIGHVGGTLIADPRRYGIDLVMPIFFAAMLVPLWRGGRPAIAWIVAGAVAIAVHQLAGGWWFIVAGAVAGSVVGGLLDDAD